MSSPHFALLIVLYASFLSTTDSQQFGGPAGQPQFTASLGASGAAQAPPSVTAPLGWPSVNAVDPCKFFENVTDVQQLNHHEYVAFEQCLYYFLANRAQHLAANSASFGAVHPIATLPPVPPYTGVPSTQQRGAGNGSSRGDIRVLASQITLQHFQLNEFLKDLHVVGYLELQWDDPRLSWDQNQWKVDHLRIHSAHHIWMPVLSSQGYETSLRNDDAMEVRKMETTSRGNVSVIVSFSLKTFCDDTDFRHFPDDVYRCCFLLEPHFNQELIEFVVDGLPVFTDPKYFRDYGWYMSGTIPSVNSDPTVVAQLNFCINLQRASSAVKIELAVPTWASAILLLFTPLFGSILLQVYLKLFLLLLQMLALQLFSNRVAPHLGSASATPVLMTVHELAIVLNVVSIVFSIIILTFIRIRRNLPPWAWLTRFTNVVNKVAFIFIGRGGGTLAPLSVENHYCYYDNSGTPNADAAEMERGVSEVSCVINGRKVVDAPTASGKEKLETVSTASGMSSGGGRYQAEWSAAFAAIHALGVTFLSVLFIFGYLIVR